MSDPSIAKIGVIALVPESFDVPWMSRHQVLTRLARFYHCVWVNPPRHWREVVGRTPRPGASAGASRRDRPPGLHVFDPPSWLPELYRPAWLRAALDRARLSGARRMLVDRGCERIVLYVWRPDFADALDRVAHDASVYHIVDEYSFSPVEKPIPDDELRLLDHASCVLIHSPGLMEKKGNVNAHTFELPNGVDYETASATRPEPVDLASVPHPRIGYCGWLKRQLDWSLIDALSERRPDLHFVLVGAVGPHPELPGILESLDRRPNVHLLGAKAPEDLLAYPAWFDACIMPYELDDYTKYIYPLKLHEYLASGAPVVARPIRTLRDFEAIIELADTEDEWSAALDRALSDEARSPTAADARRRVAQAHDWDRIAYRVATIMADAIGDDTPARLVALDVPASWKEPGFPKAP